MSIIKQAKDNIAKFILGSKSVPRELLELSNYFRSYGPINFEFHKDGDVITAVSTNFRYGSIITSGKNKEELDENIKDAIMTAFEVPSSYKKEAKISNVNSNEKEYAFA